MSSDAIFSRWLPGLILLSATLPRFVCGQPDSREEASLQVTNVPVAEVLRRLGAKLERGASSTTLNAYARHFDVSDANRDGEHSWEEFVTNGRYLTFQARAGIFRAADNDGDAVVTRAEYVRNRIITDEAKAIVQRMDSNGDGRVIRSEFVKHASQLLSDRQLAEDVFSAFDTNADGVILIPEYLRVWGWWARKGLKMPGEKPSGSRAPEEFSTNRTTTISPEARDRTLLKLPDIRAFANERSPRFLVDFEDARTGHPYFGENSDRPHTGGHVYFSLPDPAIPADQIERFPPIYAVADGIISRIDYCFRLREMYEPALQRRVANYRYGIGLSFAKMEGRSVDFHYSIEPFVNPGDAEFYDPFILVKVGQRVKRGEVIARMYLPENRDLARKSHIHFNLIGGRDHRFMAPSIFSTRIAKQFHASWHRFGLDDDVRIPPCLGFELAPHENPFGTGARRAL